MRPAPLVALLAPLAAAAVLAAAGAPPPPQPGDVVDPPPAIDATAPVLVDAGPGRIEDGGPATSVLVAPQVDAAAPAPAVEATAPVPDPAPPPTPAEPRPSPDVATPVVAEPQALADPEGERDAPPAGPQVIVDPNGLPEGIGFGGVPALAYDADNGFGFGVLGTLFWYDGVTRPYRFAVTLQIFMTTKLVQDHNIVVDWLRVADLPLRLQARAGYLQSLTQNYCGLGGDVACDPAVAEDAAADAGLVDDEAARFVARYYQRRFINPYANLQARWALTDAPARFELTGGWRGYLLIPGSWDDEDGDGAPDLAPYPGSLYATEFPDGEPGFDSVLQLGVSLDTRDNEPAPTEGVWLEASGRVASPFIGSTWAWGGANLTLRGYTSLNDERKLVLANRLVIDGVVGEPPIQELARVGGSNDVYVYGGSELGRGIRAQRYLGKLRVVDQAEVRWRFLDVEAFGQRFGFVGVGFGDAGIVGREIHDPGPMPLQVGFGGALRLSWNENFIIRADVGFSPLEGYRPSPYITVNHPF